MTTPRWLTRARRRRDEILENDAAIRQIQEDRSDEASFEGNYIKRLKLDALEKERARLSWRLTQALARGAGLDPYAVDEVTRRRLIFAAFGTSLTPSDSGATPETPPSIIVPSHPVHPGTHNRYIGWSDDTLVNVGELIGAAVFTSDVLTIPSRSANGYLWFSVDEDPGYPDSLAFQGNPTNQLPFYLEQMGPLHLNGVDYVVGLNPNLLRPANLVGKTITLGYVS